MVPKGSSTHIEVAAEPIQGPPQDGLHKEYVEQCTATYKATLNPKP